MNRSPQNSLNRPVSFFRAGVTVGLVLPFLLHGATPPQGTDAVRTIEEDATYTFTAGDFGFSDPQDSPSHQFQAVRLTSLPGAGTLLLDGIPAVAGDPYYIQPQPGIVWQLRGGLREWTQVACSSDGSVVVAAIEGGMIHTSTDGGGTWTERNPAGNGRSWSGVSISADGMRIACSAFDDQIFISEDAGVTWSRRGPANRWNGIASSANGLNLAAISQIGPVYVSADGGITWRETPQTMSGSAIACSADGSLLIVATPASIMVSRDTGATWEPRLYDLPGFFPWWSGVASSSDGQRLAAVTGGVWLSDDAGATWTASLPLVGATKVALSADGEQIFSTGAAGLYSSLDRGVTWTVKSVPHRLSNPALSGDGRHLWTTADNGRLAHSGLAPSSLQFKSVPDAYASPYTTFTFQVKDDGPEGVNLDPTPNTVTFHVTAAADPPVVVAPLPDQLAAIGSSFSFQVAADSFVDPDAGAVITYAAAQANGTALPSWLQFVPATRTFQGSPAPGDAGAWEIRVSATDQTGLSGSDTFSLQSAGVPKGSSRSATLTEESSRTFTAADFGFSDPFDTSPHTLTRIRIASLPALGTLTLNGEPVKVGDFAALFPQPGVAWDRRATFANGFLACSADGNRVLAVGNSAPAPPVALSTNAGQTWQTVEYFSTRGIVPNRAASSADGTRLVVTVPNGGRIYTSADGGQTWVPRESERNWQALACSADGSKILALDRGQGSGGRIYTSSDYGGSWTPSPWTATAWGLAASSADGQRLFIATTGAGLSDFRTSSDGGTTWTRYFYDDFQALACSGSGDRVIVGTPQGLRLSADAGVTWSGFAAIQGVSAVAPSIDGRVLTAATATGRLHVSTDGGTAWAATAETAGWSSVASSADGARLFAAGPSGIFSSTPAVPPLVYTPPLNGAGSPYTSFTYQVEDSGPPGLNLDPVANPMSLYVNNLNDTPVVAAGLPDQIVLRSAEYTYEIPTQTFSDPDPGDAQTLSATLDDGQPLPPWLRFASGTRTLSATAGTLAPGVHSIRIIARDQGVPPLEASTLLRLTVRSNPPLGTDKAVTLQEDTSYHFTAADFGFADPGDDPPNSFSKVLLASTPTAGTLSIEGVPLTAGQFVSMRPDARMLWTPRAASQYWVDIASSADGTRLAAARTDAGGSGIFLSSDAGASWTAALPGELCTAVAMSPDGTRLVAAVPNGRIHVSSDSGQTWTPTGPTYGWAAVAISAAGTHLLAAPQSGPIFVSADGGGTWTERVEFGGWTDVALSTDGSVMAVGGNSLRISTDAGVTWTERGGGASIRGLAMSADGSRIAVARADGLHYSIDRGVTWEARGPSLGWVKVAASDDGRRLVATVASSIGRLYVSDDSGWNWTPKETNQSWSAVASSADGLRLAAAAWPGMLYTSVAATPELVYQPAANESGSPYASFAFQVGDTGEGPFVLDQTPNTFTLSVSPANDAPGLAVAIPDLSATEYAPFSYQVPAGTFTDVDPGSVLTYRATLADGRELPPWLIFSPSTRTFSGTPGSLDTGSIQVVVAAADNGVPQLSGSDTFRLEVLNVPDAPAGTAGNSTLIEDVPWTFSPGDFGFTDPRDAPPGTFGRVKLTTLPAAGFLTVDGQPASPGAFVRVAPSEAGALWWPRASVQSWYSISSSADGLRLAAVVLGGRIHTSADAGISWTPRELSRSWYAIASSADGLRLAAVVQPGQIYTSEDGGGAWVPRAVVRGWRGIASSADGSRLAAIESTRQIHTSSDFGATWTPRESNRSWYSIASSADGNRLAAVVQGGRIYTSENAGATWTPRESNRNWRTITSSDDGMKLAAIDQGGFIYVSQDAGATWTAREANRNWYSIASSSDGSRLAAVVQPGWIYQSTDGGQTWKPRDTIRLWRAIASSADGSRLAAVEPQGRIYTSAVEAPQTLTFTPAPNTAGVPYASFTFQVEDDGPATVNLDPTPDIFTISVLDSNDAPTLDSIADPALIPAEAGEQTVALTGITAGGGETQVLSIEAVSSNPALVPHPAVSYASPDSQGLLRYTPVTAAGGGAIITVTVRDSGGTDNAGVNQTSRQFTVAVMTQFQRWALQHGLPTDPTADGGHHLLRFAFGMNPDANQFGTIAVAGGLIQQRGLPALSFTGTPAAPEFSVLFGLRKASDLAYRAQFSADLAEWDTSLATPIPAGSDELVDAFRLPFPAQVSGGRQPRFFRVQVVSP